MRWGIQHGTSVIPKASSESHLRSNLDVLNWELSKDDFHAISSIKIQARDVEGPVVIGISCMDPMSNSSWTGNFTFQSHMLLH